ncbi:hypothetical protein N1851_029711 [Merluccius polli]|uniref:Uncharacterized protein n=1 Tax=Merluccius polli TaxID=89951 RepID=A0AA47M6T2_MERPO|nr:hypothetical protein N1851_029711 [Merluccius polli]
MPSSSVLLSQPGRNPPSEPASQSAREGMTSLRELSYLPRREFKVQGGDQSSDISYNNVCRQIDDGIREGFTDSEIVRGVLKIIRLGIFKEMLINKDDMTVTEFKGFLQTHLKEKNSTELFQELMCTKQDENETPQQFLYRVIYNNAFYSHQNCLTLILNTLQLQCKMFSYIQCTKALDTNTLTYVQNSNLCCRTVMR